MCVSVYLCVRSIPGCSPEDVCPSHQLRKGLLTLSLTSLAVGWAELTRSQKFL